MPNEPVLCSLCGERMPEGETMFKYHGSSGPCPKPMLPPKKSISDQLSESKARIAQLEAALEKLQIKIDWNCDEFHNAKQYSETRNLLLNALFSSPSEALTTVRNAMRALKKYRDGHCKCCRSSSFEIDRDHTITDSLASLERILGGMK